MKRETPESRAFSNKCWGAARLVFRANPRSNGHEGCPPIAGAGTRAKHLPGANIEQAWWKPVMPVLMTEYGAMPQVLTRAPPPHLGLSIHPTFDPSSNNALTRPEPI